MSKFEGRRDFVHGEKAQTGIVMVNLGTPSAPTPAAIRTYLAEFLSDPRVVELPRWLWLPILHLVILTVRPRRAAHAYGKIWTEQGSPLLTHSRELSQALAAEMSDSDAPLLFDLAMRYGEPSISSVTKSMLDRGCRRILVLPLYPQYASATTASAHDALMDFMGTQRWLPQIRFINDYHREPEYVEAVASSIRHHWNEHGHGDRLLMSFHGLPQESTEAGDPYFCQCHATARLVAQNLGIEDDQWCVSFQSRVGPKRWLEPYTDYTLKRWAAEGLKQVDVICPGFAVDCLETLEEIAMQNADMFRQAGGDQLRYIPALNASRGQLEALKALLLRNLEAWPSPQGDVVERQLVAERARALGASN